MLIIVAIKVEFCELELAPLTKNPVDCDSESTNCGDERATPCEVYPVVK